MENISNITLPEKKIFIPKDLLEKYSNVPNVSNMQMNPNVSNVSNMQNIQNGNQMTEIPKGMKVFIYYSDDFIIIKDESDCI